MGHLYSQLSPCSPQQGNVKGLLQIEVLVRQDLLNDPEPPPLDFCRIDVAHLLLRDDPDHGHDVDPVVRDQVLAVLAHLSTFELGGRPDKKIPKLFVH